MEKKEYPGFANNISVSFWFRFALVVLREWLEIRGLWVLMVLANFRSKVRSSTRALPFGL